MGGFYMIPIEFGIVDTIENKDYVKYEPQNYNCVTIDDNLYINDWWEDLLKMKTYFHNINRPSTALARWGITLIPPESLSIFNDIVTNDLRIQYDDNLKGLLSLIEKAIKEKNI